MLCSIFNRDFFCFLIIVLCTDQFSYNDYLDLCGFQVKWNTINLIKMADSRWRMVPDPFLTLNRVIMTSLLLFKIIK